MSGDELDELDEHTVLVAGLWRFHRELELAGKLWADAYSSSTSKAYRLGWRAFREYCAERSLIECPATPETVAAYVAFLVDEDYRRSTIELRLTACRAVHSFVGEAWPDTPELRQLLRGARKTLALDGRGARQPAAALVLDDLRACLATCTRTKTRDVRDGCMLSLGFWGAFRSAELVALEWRDISFKKSGALVHLRHSKTGEAITPVRSRAELVECPIRWLRAYRRHCKTERLFPCITRTISNRVKARAVRAELVDGDQYSAHSLRSGFVTTALAAGVASPLICRVTHHTSSAALNAYLVPATHWTAHPADRM